MSERDDLATVIEAAYDLNEGMVTFELLAHAVLAAGYRKTRTITTADELDALPVGSVIRTLGNEDEHDPRVAVKDGYWLNESEWYVADDSEWVLDSSELDDLPATVLYEPGATK